MGTVSGSGWFRPVIISSCFCRSSRISEMADLPGDRQRKLETHPNSSSIVCGDVRLGLFYPDLIS